MRSAILAIGTELVRGEIENTNATWLARRLVELGLEVGEIAVVADDRSDIESTLRRLAETHGAVVCTGGLGPTTDDITRECAANVAGVTLERDAASLEAIRARMARFGREVAASNARQADFPRGAEVLSNPHGTAPGFALGLGGALAFFMPGVPREMRPMFDDRVAPKLPRPATAAFQVRLRTFGLPESQVNDRLAGVEAEQDVILGYRASFPEIEVKVLARRATAESAETAARSAVDVVRERLGDVVYGEGERGLPEVVAALLRERSLTLGLAESCTGGLAASLLTAHSVSDVFNGGVVSYANSAKMALLGVPEGLLVAHGAVSEPVARAMAEGARRALAVDVALSLTGIAGPGGDTPGKPLGLVHFAVATAAGTVAKERVFPGDRPQVQRLAAFAGFDLVRRTLLTG